MATTDNLGDFLTSVANAIRSKSGSTAQINAQDFASEIENLPSGGTELPAYMSAKNFTFDGNSCTGYVGDNTLPEIIIPKSYSTVTSIETVVGAKVLDKENLSMSIYDFQSATFSDGGTNTQTYTSTSQLQNLSADFPNDCYLVSMQGSNPFSFDFLHMASDMQMLQFPIAVNGQSFSDGMTAFDYIMEHDITNANFGGDVEVTKFVDGDDYQVTSVSGSSNGSGFKNYQNRIILLSNLTSIGDYAFQNCSSLTSIEIPSGVTSIGNSAFDGCSSLSSITIPESVTSIRTSAFYGCSSLTSIEIPSGVTSIGNYTFRGCSALETVTFGDNSQLESIEGYAFDDCFNLTSINIPSSVTSIGQGAFNNCSSLTSIEIPSSVIKIRDRAFAGTPWFANLQNTSYGIATASDGQTRFVIDVPTDITDDELDMTNVKVIAEDAFDDCTNLASITIPDSVTSIGSSAFTGCSSLEKVNITDIDAWAMIDFANSSANPLYYGAELYLNGELVTQVTLSIATSIGSSAFSGCSGLTEIVIPEGVTSIGNYAFWGCSSLTTMTVLPTTPPTLSSTNAISTATTKIYIPAGTLSAYQSATNWSNFASLFEELPQ